MLNQDKQARMSEVMNRLNLQLAERRRNKRKPRLAQKKEQLSHASLICKMFNKSLRITLKEAFGSKELILKKFMILENFLVTPNNQFIDVENIEEVNFV